MTPEEIDAAHDAARIENWLDYPVDAEYGIDLAHEAALEVEKLIAIERTWDEARAWTLRIIDAAHDEALFEAAEREYAARRGREALIAAIFVLWAAFQILHAVLGWLQWKAGR